jgi:hypothetical protein
MRLLTQVQQVANTMREMSQDIPTVFVSRRLGLSLSEEHGLTVSKSGMMRKNNWTQGSVTFPAAVRSAC